MTDWLLQAAPAAPPSDGGWAISDWPTLLVALTALGIVVGYFKWLRPVIAKWWRQRAKNTLRKFIDDETNLENTKSNSPPDPDAARAALARTRKAAKAASRLGESDQLRRYALLPLSGAITFEAMSSPHVQLDSDNKGARVLLRSRRAAEICRHILLTAK